MMKKAKDEMPLVLNKGNSAVTTSLIVAEKFGKKHQHVLRDINGLSAKGVDESFRLSNFGQSNYVNEQGKEQPYYEITRDGFVLLVMGYTGQKAMQFKIEYINAFNRMEKFIVEQRLNRTDLNWNAARKDGKKIRLAETDVIQKLQDYAGKQGSTHPEKFFVNYSKMTNAMLIELPLGVKTKSVRDCLDGQQLMIIGAAEKIIAHAIEDGMNQGLHYKEIYQDAKQRVESVSKAIGRKMIPANINPLLK